MPRQLINVGQFANDRKGDPLRSAFIKINQNFQEVYSDVESIGSQIEQVAGDIPVDISQLTDEEGLLGQGGISSEAPFLVLTNNPFIFQDITFSDPEIFTKVDGDTSNTAIDYISSSVALTRANNGGLFNVLTEELYNQDVSPEGTLWNSDGWGDLKDYRTRDYVPFRESLDYQIGNNILSAELIMLDVAENKYYTFDFSSWTQNNNGGGFSYTRRQIVDPNLFLKTDYGSEVDVFVEDDGEGSGIGITRGNNQGIFNPYREDGWNSNVSPIGTLWNVDGWDDLTNIETRTYTNFYDAYDGNLGNNVPGSKAVMYIPDNDTYYAIEWLSWTQNNAGGGFSYTRRVIDINKLNEGIKFPDGSVLKTADGLGRVKSTASRERRIEEVFGSKTVSVTESVTNTYTGLLNRTTNINFEIYVARNIELDEILFAINNNEINPSLLEISLDGGSTYNPAFLSSVRETEYWFYYTGILGNDPVPQVEGDSVAIRITTGAEPVVWWNKNELPSGGSNFRGAVINYHAYTGEATFIGTIHIVDDNGEEHISHTEVSSGSDDSENDDLWFVSNEGRISYRRIDGEAKTLRVHWTAKVFYGSELYD